MDQCERKKDFICSDAYTSSDAWITQHKTHAHNNGINTEQHNDFTQNIACDSNAWGKNTFNL